MLLIDSGGQYDVGTTDVTRTVHLGRPTAWQRECFTRVLKGHIGLASAVFPEGTPGPALDAFARAALWQVGAAGGWWWGGVVVGGGGGGGWVGVWTCWWLCWWVVVIVVDNAHVHASPAAMHSLTSL